MIKYLAFEKERTSIYFLYRKSVINESFYKTINDLLKYYLIDLSSYNKNYRKRFSNTYLNPIYIKPNLCLIPINGIKSGGPVINYFAIKSFVFSDDNTIVTWKDDSKTSFAVKKVKWNNLIARTKRVIELYL